MGYPLRMAAPHPGLIDALRETAERLRKGSDYKWANFGLCNCGHLAQTVTHISAKDIHEAALEKGGDWGEQAREYCGTTGLAMDHILDSLMSLGLSHEDINDIERLSNPKVLKRMGETPIGVSHYARSHAIQYFETWADLLEEALPQASRLAAK